MNPHHFINWIESLIRKGRIKDEVAIRRVISAIYFALFNYWARKRYDMESRAGGPLGDCFRYSQFHSELLRKGLDAEIILLYTYHVAVDHYTLNPTIIRIFDRALKKLGRVFRCKITLGNPSGTKYTCTNTM